MSAAVVVILAFAALAVAAAVALVSGQRHRHRRLLCRAAQVSTAAATLMVQPWPILLLLSRRAAWPPQQPQQQQEDQELLHWPSPSLEQLPVSTNNSSGSSGSSGGSLNWTWGDLGGGGGGSSQLSQAYWAKVLRFFPNGGPDSPQYRLLEDRCVTGNAASATATAAAPRHHPGAPRQHPTGFTDAAYLINPGSCQGHVSILVGVHSAVGHASRRRIIRETWGSFRYVRGRRLRLVFFLGRPEDSQLQAGVMEEAERHRDIVQRDFLDTYRNMTLKHLSLYDWLAEFCQLAEWLVKVDDDVFIDVFHLASFLEANRPDGIACKVQDGKPERELGAKWFVTRTEFAGDKYPKYCEGYAYIMRPTVAMLLYWCSVFSAPMWIDDVYVLGILVQRLGLKAWQPVGGRLWTDLVPSHAGKAIMDSIFLVDRRNSPQPGTWRRLHRAAMLYSY